MKKIDYGVIEVGLGGRLDSTNVIIPKVSVITSISMDHINILGNTIEEIAKEKSGIIKEDVPVILYPQKKEAEDVILKAAHNNNSKVYYVKTDDGNLKGIDYDNITQNVQVNGLNGIYNVDLPLLGEHQILNLCVAIKAVEVLCQVEKFNIIKKL